MEAARIVAIAAGIGVMGVIAGGLLTLMGGRFQLKETDRRLRTQLANDAEQRRQGQVLAIKLESIDRLGTFIEKAPEAASYMLSETASVGDKAAAFLRMSVQLQKTVVSMQAIEVDEVFNDLKAVQEVLTEIFGTPYADSGLALRED